MSEWYDPARSFEFAGVKRLKVDGLGIFQSPNGLGYACSQWFGDGCTYTQALSPGRRSKIVPGIAACIPLLLPLGHVRSFVSSSSSSRTYDEKDSARLTPWSIKRSPTSSVYPLSGNVTWLQSFKASMPRAFSARSSWTYGAAFKMAGPV